MSAEGGEPDAAGRAMGGGVPDAEDTGTRSEPAAGRDSALRVDAIVVAAGESRRMGGVDKTRVVLAGRPLLRWTLDALAAPEEVERIVVVAAPAAVASIAAEHWLPHKVAAVVAGAGRRQESVAAGFEALDGSPERVVLVHDAARPLATPALVGSIARAAAAYGAAIPVVPIVETLKRTEGGTVLGTVDREALGAAQTPQGFRRGLLAAAYAEHPPSGDLTWTDEAALLEACRIAVHAIPGEPMNLKVTLPEDLARAEAILAAQVGARGIDGEMRVGFGSDSHPFGPGSPLVLGGVVFDGAPALHGHSDGDVVLHAVADALLGGAGLGDLGRMFPATHPTPRGISSREMLAAVADRINTSGFRVRDVDVTVVGSRPRLGVRLDEMRAAIAMLLDLDEPHVNVKASTGNLGGREGTGRGIAAEVVAVLAPSQTGAAPS